MRARLAGVVLVLATLLAMYWFRYEVIQCTPTFNCVAMDRWTHRLTIFRLAASHQTRTAPETQ